MSDKHTFYLRHDSVKKQVTFQVTETIAAVTSHATTLFSLKPGSVKLQKETGRPVYFDLSKDTVQKIPNGSTIIVAATDFNG